MIGNIMSNTHRKLPAMACFLVLCYAGFLYALYNCADIGFWIFIDQGAELIPPDSCNDIRVPESLFENLCGSLNCEISLTMTIGIIYAFQPVQICIQYCIAPFPSFQVADLLVRQGKKSSSVVDARQFILYREPLYKIQSFLEFYLCLSTVFNLFT